MTKTFIQTSFKIKTCHDLEISLQLKMREKSERRLSRMEQNRQIFAKTQRHATLTTEITKEAVRIVTIV